MSTQLTWSSRNQPSSGQFFVFAGRAYPKVWKGDNPTDTVRARVEDREAFYRDPAVVLSDANLDAFNGGEKTPLCLEHNSKREVGYVHHSWIGDGDHRALKIIGRIPLFDRSGHPINRDVVEDIKAGKYAGLSVGYGNSLAAQNNGTTKVRAKTFREISLVSEPFFDNCKLSSVRVTASKEGTKNPEYLATTDNDYFQLGEIQMSETTQENNKQQQQQHEADPVPAEELLRQADSLKAEAEAKGKEAAATQEMVRQLQAELAKTKAINDRFLLKDKAEREAYAAKSKDELESFLKYLEESGANLTDQKRKDYSETFLNPDLKDYKDDLMAGQRRTVELMASKRALEEESANKLKLEQEKARMLEATMAKTTQVLNHSRTAFAQAMSPKQVGEEDALDSNTRQVAVQAGRHLSEIMCAEPSAVELPWLQKLGYSNEVDVEASSRGFRTSKSFPTHFKPAPEHKHLYDANGEPELSNSMRYRVPAWFAMLARPEMRDVDLKTAGVHASFIDETQEQRAEDWESRHLMNRGTQGVTIQK